jgi:hypothetical protein
MTKIQNVEKNDRKGILMKAGISIIMFNIIAIFGLTGCCCWDEDPCCPAPTRCCEKKPRACPTPHFCLERDIGYPYTD